MCIYMFIRVKKKGIKKRIARAKTRGLKRRRAHGVKKRVPFRPSSSSSPSFFFSLPRTLPVGFFHYSRFPSRSPRKAAEISIRAHRRPSHTPTTTPAVVPSPRSPRSLFLRNLSLCTLFPSRFPDVPL